MEKAIKKYNRYKLSLEAIDDNTDHPALLNKTEFKFENHDDLFKVIELAKGKNLFAEERETIEFVIGLKLFSEVILRNRELPLFDELKPAVKEFMKKLKSI